MEEQSIKTDNEMVSMRGSTTTVNYVLEKTTKTANVVTVSMSITTKTVNYMEEQSSKTEKKTVSMRGSTKTVDWKLEETSKTEKW